MFRQLSYRKSTEKLIERARLEPRYNIAPTQQVPVILTVSARSLESERKSKPNPFWLGLSGLRPQALARILLLQQDAEDVAESTHCAAGDRLRFQEQG